MSTKKNVYKSILFSGLVVPAMGVVAHFMPGKATFDTDDASLAERFETAYTLRVDADRRTYTSYELVPHNPHGYVADARGVLRPLTRDGDVISNARVMPGEPYDTYYSEERYVCNPYMIYPLHFFAAWGAYAALKRREEWMQENNINNRNR